MKGTERVSRRHRIFFGGIVALGLIVTVSSIAQENESETFAKIPRWSERLGMGEVFPACGSSFVLSCVSPVNACGQANAGIVQVDGSCSATTPPDSSCPVPGVSMNVSLGRSTIDEGQSVTLSWESPDAVSCRWAGNGTDSAASSTGSISTGPLTSTTAYQICCAYASGVCGPAAQVIVTVLHPFAAISAEPVRVRVGGSVTVAWETRDVGSCAVTKNGIPYLAPSGASDTVTTQTTYTITCQTNGDPLIKSARVNVVPLFEEF